MPTRRGVWWRAYLYFEITLTALALVVPIFLWDDVGTNWHHLAFIPVDATQIVGLYAFVHAKRIANSRILQMFFVIAFGYEFWVLYETYIYAQGLQPLSTFTGFEAILYGFYLTELPMWVGLFIYAFRSGALWSRAS